MGLQCFCKRNVVLYLNISDKDGHYGACRENPQEYFTNDIYRNFDVMIFNDIKRNCQKRATFDSPSSLQMIY